MDVTKPYKFTRVGAMEVIKPYKSIGFGAMDVTKPYKFTRFGAMDGAKPYKFIGFGARAPGGPGACGRHPKAMRWGFGGFRGPPGIHHEPNQ